MSPGDGDWQAECGITKLIANQPYGCGIACLAMVAGLTLDEARERFVSLGLGIRRGSRAAFSTASFEMRMAIANAGLVTATRRWKGWAEFTGLGVIKIKADWRGAPGQWYWAVAFRHPSLGIVLFDPHHPLPSFEHMPFDVECCTFTVYEGKGEWLQVEQRDYRK